MSKVQFAVSAKTARLIGRENISDVDGALIELIKNSYDADAKCVFIAMNIPFPTVPKNISYTLCNSVFDSSEMSYLFEFYNDTGINLEKIDNLSVEKERELCNFLHTKNSITIMDNGYGMTEEILTSAWMNIGTNDKEERRISPEGRVKTGAKGIGRFALDKLSTSTTVITKHKDDCLKTWNIDWEQFETASLLDEVSATIDNGEGCFEEIAKRVTGNRFKAFVNYNWETGTIIRLTPTRENWSEAYFAKVNKNLKSLFPGTNTSQFDIYVTNIYYPQYSFANERFNLDNSEFDYKITGSFDGKDNISVEIFRNEIDTRKLKATINYNGKTKDFSLSEFWGREAFRKTMYSRPSFAKTVKYSFSASELTKTESSRLESVGPFDLEMYFLKNTSSPIDIVKPVITSKRKDIINSFSGIKMYRDGFKVRPYGEEDGPSFDWLSLGVRVQKSPAAISHQSGSWRVRGNQIIGAVRITKDGNPNLSDMANREGLATNDAFKTFKNIIEKILETFEYDRQYIFREYALWIKEKETELSKTSQIIESIKNEENKNDENSKKSSPKTSETVPSSKQQYDNFSRDDYETAILELEEQRERQERATKTMMLYSSAGVMTNTFSHEISRIMTQAGSRMQHLRHSVKRLVGNEGYKGHSAFNPFPIIDQVESVDMLLENWLSVIMSGTDEKVFSKQDLNISKSLNKIIATWKPLLQEKLIKINPLTIVGNEENCVCNLAEIDLLIIINNFMLNSAHFLEKSSTGNRTISISIAEEEERVFLELENNGPQLDSIFANNPDKIFEAGVSTKITDDGKGSGIGLWITKTLVLDNSGEIHVVVEKTNGFCLRITLPK